MSVHNDMEWARDSARGQALLRAHLSAGMWKSEAWALSDSLAWALGLLATVYKPGENPDESGVAGAEWQLAQHRLRRAQKELESAVTEGAA